MTWRAIGREVSRFVFFCFFFVSSFFCLVSSAWRPHPFAGFVGVRVRVSACICMRCAVSVSVRVRQLDWEQWGHWERRGSPAAAAAVASLLQLTFDLQSPAAAIALRAASAAVSTRRVTAPLHSLRPLQTSPATGTRRGFAPFASRSVPSANSAAAATRQSCRDRVHEPIRRRISNSCRPHCHLCEM